MNAPVILILLCAVSLGLVVVFLMYLRARDQTIRLDAALDVADARARAAEIQVLAAEAHARDDKEAREAMANFLSAQAAKSAEEIVKRAEDSQQGRDALTQARLEAQLKPVTDTLTKFEEHISAVEKIRAEETGGLKEQIAALLQASLETQTEARKLSTALKRGAGVQGRWGEQMCRNTLELAGLRHRIDFEEQAHVDTVEGRYRPDFIVRLPGGGAFVIDAKVANTAFTEALEATDDLVREAAWQRHATSVKGHFQGLAAKAYWDQLELSPDFVAMFIPGDGFLAAALDRMPELMSEAMEKRVILVTPTTLFALCKAVSYGWRVEKQALNAAEIAKLGRELYKRLSVMGDHVAGVGRALGQAVGSYNRFVGSLETQVLTQARRFEDLQVDHEGKEIAELAAVEAAPRSLAKLAGETLAAPTPALTLEGPPPTSLPS